MTGCLFSPFTNFENMKNTFDTMEAKKKAVQLVKITFEKVAKASTYKDVHKGDGKQFGIIEHLSKQIAIDFVDEMIKEFEKSDSIHATKFLANYWKDVKYEIVCL